MPFLVMFQEIVNVLQELVGVLEGDHLGEAVQFFTVRIIQLKGAQTREIPKAHVQAGGGYVVHIATVGVVVAGRLPMDIQIDARSFGHCVVGSVGVSVLERTAQLDRSPQGCLVPYSCQ